MSRYGKIPIPVPEKVEIKKVDGMIHVKGPKGEIKLPLEKGIHFHVENQKVVVSVDEKLSVSKAMHGLYRSLINNLIIGVSKGFVKKLTFVGVGYRVELKGNQLHLQVGYSHPNQIDIPSGLKVSVDKQTAILIEGIDKQVVGQFAATIRAVRPPEPYKGKGIRYEGEYVRKKAGKAAKSKTA